MIFDGTGISLANVLPRTKIGMLNFIRVVPHLKMGNAQQSSHSN